MLTFIRKRPFILFILPGIVVYTIFITAPIVVSIPFSLTGLTTTGHRVFVGIEGRVADCGPLAFIPSNSHVPRRPPP